MLLARDATRSDADDGQGDRKPVLIVGTRLL